MKKKIITIMLAVLVFCVLSITAFAAQLGDINGDGKITASDARKTLRVAAGIDFFDDEVFSVADVDKSGKITASDARKILRVAANLDAPFEGLNIDEYLIEKGVLHVAVPKDNAPFAYEENGELKGYDVSLAQKLAEYTNLKLELHPMTYDECVAAVKNGECDIATSFDRNKYNYDKGIEQPVSYCDLTLRAIVNKDSTIISVKDFENDPNVRIGVLDNTISERIVELGFDKSQITAFSTCGQAAYALETDRLDVFITMYDDDFLTDYVGYTVSANKSVKSINYENYYSYDHSVIFAEGKYEMINKIFSFINLDGISGYKKINDSGTITVSQKNITLAPGGTACIEFTPKSFYSVRPEMYTPNNSTGCYTTIVRTGGKYRIIISTYSDFAEDGSITLALKSGNNDVECKIYVDIDSAGPKNYQYFDGVNIPDFGVYTGTSPLGTGIYTKEKIMIHTYSAAELYNNGVTDNTKLDCYLDALEAAGYKYMGYQEIENVISLIFMDEKTQKYVHYMEAYDADGYLISVGISYPFPDSIC